MIAPFSSDIGVTAFESSAYGKCSCASKYVWSTKGFLSLHDTPTKRFRFRKVNWWEPRDPRRGLNGEPGSDNEAWRKKNYTIDILNSSIIFN